MCEIVVCVSRMNTPVSSCADLFAKVVILLKQAGLSSLSSQMICDVVMAYSRVGLAEHAPSLLKEVSTELSSRDLSSLTPKTLLRMLWSFTIAGYVPCMYRSWYPVVGANITQHGHDGLTTHDLAAFIYIFAAACTTRFFEIQHLTLKVTFKFFF